MIWEKYQAQIMRLNNHFRKSYDSKELLNLIWREFQNTDDDDFREMVNLSISELRYPPLLPELRTLAARVREKRHAYTKSQYRQDAEAFMESTLTPDEQGWIMGEIRRILKGEMSETDQIEFKEMLRKLGESSPFRCKKCRDSGILSAKMRGETSGNYAFRCDCPFGDQRQETFPRWTTGYLNQFLPEFGGKNP